MKYIINAKENAKVRQNDIIDKRKNASRFGTQSLRSLGPKRWNNLPLNIKWETSFPKFKEYIKTWLGPKCRCKVCINMWIENVLLFSLYINSSSFYIYLWLLVLFKNFSSDLIRFYARFIFFYFCTYADLLFSEDKSIFIHSFIWNFFFPNSRFKCH